MPHKKKLFAWIALGHFYKKKIVLKTIKKISSQLQKKTYLLGSPWDTFIKTNFFATIKIFFETIKKIPSQL